jgi:ADP-ribose pyrophosphatase YjhB (NUDIX family)
MKDYEQISFECKMRWLEEFKLNGEKYTQVSGYIFNDKNELLIVKNGDNFTIPGGHPEINEKPIETLIREIMEEACVKIKNIKYLGAVEIVEKNETYYQLRYTAQSSEILPFKTDWETSERLFVKLENLHKYIKWSKGITFNQQIDSARKVWQF